MKKLALFCAGLLMLGGCAAGPYYGGGGGIVGYPGGFDNCVIDGGWNCDVFDYGHGYYVRRRGRDRDDDWHPVFHRHDNDNPTPNWQPEWHPNPQPEWHQNFHPGWNGGNIPNFRPEGQKWHPEGGFGGGRRH